MITLEINFLDNFFDFILHIKGGVKYYLISIALIAQLVEQQVSTLKVVGSSLARDRFFLLIEELSMSLRRKKIIDDVKKNISNLPTL